MDPKGSLSHLGRPSGWSKTSYFSAFLATPVSPKEPKGAPWSPWLLKNARFHVFSAPGNTNCNKTTCFGHFDPPKRPLGARGQKWPREQSKMLSWDAFLEGRFFWKICPCTQTPYTQKRKPHTHIHTNTPIALPPCAYTHTHIHANTPIALPPCAYTHTRIHTNTLNFRRRHI